MLIRHYASQRQDTSSAADFWRHDYDRRLVPDKFNAIVAYDAANPQMSAQYNDEKSACEQGWPTIMASVTTFIGDQAKYENTTCFIYQNGMAVGKIDIQNDAYEPGATGYRALKAERPDGKVIRFVLNNGKWTVEGSARGRLSVNSSTGGFQYLNERNEIEQYNTKFQLTSITNMNHLTQNLAYNTLGQLTTVTNSYGQSLSFGYDTQGRLSSVTAPGSRTWTYIYTTSGQLKSVINPDGTTRQYLYENADFPNALTGILDERNIRYGTYEYDSAGRATSSYHAGNADRIDISYNTDGSRTVTDSRGNATTYTFLSQAGTELIKQISGPGCASCGDGNTTYSYDVQNRLISKTQNNVTTRYNNYNGNGHPQQIIEAAGTPQQRYIYKYYYGTFLDAFAQFNWVSVVSGSLIGTYYIRNGYGQITQFSQGGYSPGSISIGRTINYQYSGPLTQLLKNRRPSHGYQ